MVLLLVVLTIVILIGIDFFLLKKGGTSEKRERRKISSMLNLLPKGFFIQPDFTWSTITKSGEVKIGIHPLILGLTGNPDEIVVINEEENVKKGEPIIKLIKDGKTLALKSPVEGEIKGVNRSVMRPITTKELSRKWFYRIEPVDVKREIPGWYVSESAKEWARNQYDQMRDFFTGRINSSAIPSAADGGEILQGVMDEMNTEDWDEFEKKFLA